MTAPDERPVDGRFGMPTEGMAEAIADAGLPSSVWAVYCALCLFADRDTRTCKPSQGRLARNARLTERGVRNALALGVKHGLWSVEYRYKRARTATSKGEQTTSEYTVHDWDLAHLRPELTSGRPAGSSTDEPGGPELTSAPARNSLPGEGGTHFRPGPELTSDEQTSLARPLGSYLSSHTHPLVSDGRTCGAPSDDEPGEHEQDDDGRPDDVEAAVPASPPESVPSTPGLDGGVVDASAPAPVSPPRRVSLGALPAEVRSLSRAQQQGRIMARLHASARAAGFALLDLDRRQQQGHDWRERGRSHVAFVVGQAVDNVGPDEALRAAERWLNEAVVSGSSWLLPLAAS